MQPLSPNQPSLRKFNLLLITIAAVSMIVSSCNKFPLPGGPVGNPTAITCNIQDFDLAPGIKNSGVSNYPNFAYQLSPWANQILISTQNIQYNNHDQPILAYPGNNQDSMYTFQYDNLNRLSVVTVINSSYVNDSLDIETFRYKPGSILPDSVYLEDITKGPNGALSLAYTLGETYTYDNFQRLSKINYSAYSQSVGNPLYQRFHYNTQGDLDTVYENISGSLESPQVIVRSYDTAENCMLTNSTWTILSNQYSLHNPTNFTYNLNEPDGTVFLSYTYSMSYLYGGAAGKLPVSFFDSKVPSGQSGSIIYACTIGGGVTPVTGGQ